MAGDNEQETTSVTPPEERGDRPILEQGPTFEVRGRTYTMRRLGYADHGRFAVIFRAAWRGGKVDLAAVAERGDPKEQIEAAISLLLAAFAEGGSETLDFLAAVIGVDKKVLLDPEYFPFGSLPLILRKLSEHPDLADFFVGIGALAGGLPTLMPGSSGRPTSSPSATATPTPQS